MKLFGIDLGIKKRMLSAKMCAGINEGASIAAKFKFNLHLKPLQGKIHSERIVKFGGGIESVWW